MTNRIDPQVVNQAEPTPDWHKEAARRGGKIVKIVLGPSPGETPHNPVTLAALPGDFATLFPNLTHLHLWQLKGLRAIPPLPPTLQCLDLRGCADLETLPKLPAGLERLLLDGCAKLEFSATFEDCGWPRMFEASFKGALQLHDAWIDRFLRQTPNVASLDLSGCPSLENILLWPSKLVRIDLNDCPKLRTLPAKWPANLRRLGLRSASALRKLADFPPSLDYVDLAFTTSLQALPARRANPRTLHLHGSGIQEPPAVLHGDKPDVNVAAATRSYFEDIQIAGKLPVMRCKLLLLGNGGAGKTCLALRLTPGMDPKRDNPGTTHGIQFFDWKDFEAEVDSRNEQVHLHLWDFGGQEIYHNTHRLFMAKGTVFVVLWHPQQDGAQPPPTPEGYQDEWRSQQYWLDLIHEACPQEPRIAIVCSIRGQKPKNPRELWRRQVDARHHDLAFFEIDSLAETGDLPGLHDWLRKKAGEVIHTQGSSVPAYWEIAQGMVESWLPKPSPGGATPPAATFQTLAPQDFQNELAKAIERAINADTDDRYTQLAEARKTGAFKLNLDRVHRALAFLTGDGWVYWTRELFEGRVIIGQEWALAGIYTVLDRRPNSLVYKYLSGRSGQFTREDLDQLGWKDSHTKDEQKLLISFMRNINLCFQLVSEADSLWSEPVYISVEHLPTSAKSRLGLDSGAVAETIPCAYLHKGHWHAILKHLGEQFGKDAEYASDGFQVENKQKQRIFISAVFQKEVTVRVAGPEARGRLAELVQFVRGFLPVDLQAATPPSPLGASQHAVGEAAGTIEVFFSYTWDVESNQIPQGYEEPVNALENALKSEPMLVVLRDKTSIKDGGQIVQFMQKITTTDKVIIFHSDKYWKSTFCVSEIWSVFDSFKTKPVRMEDVLVLIEHATSDIGNSGGLETYQKYWQALKSMPTTLGDQTEFKKLKTRALGFFQDDVPKLTGMVNRNKRWGQDNHAEVIEWAKQLILRQPPTSNP